MAARRLTDRRLVVVGDALLDRDLVGSVERLAPDAPVPVLEDIDRNARPGGAALAATLAALDGHPVTFVTALADDVAGAELRDLLEGSGVDVVDLGLDGETPEKVRVRSGSQAFVRLDYGCTPGTPGPLTDEAAAAIAGGAAVLVADYGRGLAERDDVRGALARVPSRTPLVWDPHRRGAQPVAGARLVTPNNTEAGCALGAHLATVTTRARELRERWQAAAVSITLGSRGALLVSSDGPPLAVPAPVVADGDTCGAGDRFASTVTAALAEGALLPEAVSAGVAVAAAFVEAGGAASLRLGPMRVVDLVDAEDDLSDRDAFAVIERVRARGGTVVATGGCFDLLHAGHVRSLEAARSLGDCLIVCLNSDDSVRRLKGPSRPLQTEADRASVLLGLGSVDAVVVFDEDTPEAILTRLRPDVWAKGGDYSAVTLPEAALVTEWGGQAVILPYLEGRSTTRLVKEAARRAEP